MQNGKAVVVVVQDLFFAVRLSDALRAMGYRGRTVETESQLRTAMADLRPQLVILDLQAHGIEPSTVVTVARQAVLGQPVPVLAYGPHTDLKLREQALQAGVHRVVSKSLLTAEFPQLVKSIMRT